MAIRKGKRILQVSILESQYRYLEELSVKSGDTKSKWIMWLIQLLAEIQSGRVSLVSVKEAKEDKNEIN